MQGIMNFRVFGASLRVAIVLPALFGCIYTRGVTGSPAPPSAEVHLKPQEDHSVADIASAQPDLERLGALFDGIVASVQQTPKHSEQADAGEDTAEPQSRRLPNEPEDAQKLLQLLLADEEAMELWKTHFARHVTQNVRRVVLKLSVAENAGSEVDVATPQGSEPESVLRLAGEEDFWESRPASSMAAVQLIREKMAKRMQSSGETAADMWIAEVSQRFRYLSMKDAKRQMGTFLVHAQVQGGSGPQGTPLPPKTEFKNAADPIPESFDTREAFPACTDVVGHVRDQGDCGSCWAFASTEAFNDRLCIRSQGKANAPLSPQHTTSCCNALHCASFGCNGGQPGMAWRWFQRKGVVTGGDYDALQKGTTCWPYEVPFCAHHVKAPFPDCDASVAPRHTPKCRKDCEETNYTANVHPFEQDLHKASSAYSLRSRDDVKRDMMAHGTVTGAFIVYEDFLNYKAGVYKHVSGSPVGGHAIKIIGWGTEGGEDYWLAVNSWNDYWGDKGLFKIKMGEGGIDDEMVAGEAAWEEVEGAVNADEAPSLPSLPKDAAPRPAATGDKEM
ncbi:cathepsin B [Besnoitia besnoiti]|uniref:Cathepsin B n=1 Tax=Besnoitia besnoiti TaxID=94643 RepID=A0A2A9MP32_BESBE|nr:cathepsin B [Besnoitia besnoiti]PFH38056.1 cathepsin B [Besnoitia besnoiti]